MLLTRVSRTFKFDAAHKLPHYDGKCKNMHGHTWKLRVTLVGTRRTNGPQKGMILDFSDLKDIVNKFILNQLDHSVINDYYDNPTAENLADWIFQVLDEALQTKFSTEEVYLESVRVYESDDSYAEVVDVDASK